MRAAAHKRRENHIREERQPHILRVSTHVSARREKPHIIGVGGN